jgi:hypothetical protein
MFALGRTAGRRLLVRAAPAARPAPAAAVAAAMLQRGLASSSSAAALEGYHKTSTGLVGLKANPNAREDLIAQQKALLDKIKVRWLVDGWAGFGRTHVSTMDAIFDRSSQRHVAHGARRRTTSGPSSCNRSGSNRGETTTTTTYMTQPPYPRPSSAPTPTPTPSRRSPRRRSTAR